MHYVRVSSIVDSTRDVCIYRSRRLIVIAQKPPSISTFPLPDRERIRKKSEHKTEATLKCP